MNANNRNANAKLLPFVFQLASAAAGMLLLSPRSTGASNPPAYATDFADRSAVLAAWTPQEGCAHCTKGSVPEAGGGKDECTNMTIAATSFSAEGMTHTTLALPASSPTSCVTEQQVCSSGHMTWDPPLLFGNFSVVARWFPGEAARVRTSTGFIGLDSPSNEASITMGFHGLGWLGGNGEGPHRYQHGIYADVKQSHNREYTPVESDLSSSFHRYGLLWTPTLVEWRLDGRVVRVVKDTSIIPKRPMQLRLHTRSGYCDQMASSASFNATFRSFSYEPVTHAPPSPPASPTPPSPGGDPLATGTRSAAALSPADAVHALAAYILNDTADVSEFQRWGYGQSIILDAMMLASESVPGMEHVMDAWVNPVLDHYLSAQGQPAFNLTHGLDISAQFIGNAVGDKIGLFPHAYLHRYEHYGAATGRGASAPPPEGYDAAKDLQVAKRALDDYILKWPIRWTDNTVTRDYPGTPPSPWGPETGEHQFVWGDDSYMGLTLPARMVVAGLDNAAGDYARFAATQHALFAHHLLPTPAEGGGIYWHGRDAKSGAPSCCKWGRANGWTMMTHVEVLTALNASAAPFAAAASKKAQSIFVAHATALAAVQNTSDGRWHQLLDNRSMWLETSCTAMFTVAMVRGVDAGWLDAATFEPVIKLAWQGLSRVIDADGYVHGMCDGFGIHGTVADYAGCKQAYGRGQPGLGSVLKAAVLLAKRAQARR